MIGEPDIIPWSFKKAIIEPEKVIAPTAAPIDISIKLANLILPEIPKDKLWVKIPLGLLILWMMGVFNPYWCVYPVCWIV